MPTHLSSFNCFKYQRWMVATSKISIAENLLVIVVQLAHAYVLGKGCREGNGIYIHPPWQNISEYLHVTTKKLKQCHNIIIIIIIFTLLTEFLWFPKCVIYKEELCSTSGLKLPDVVVTMILAEKLNIRYDDTFPLIILETKAKKPFLQNNHCHLMKFNGVFRTLSNI